MWLPHGWYLILDNMQGKWRYLVGADGIGETQSKPIYNTERQASAQAKAHLRRAAKVLMDSGWTQNRVHLRIYNRDKAFCGAMLSDSPNTKNAYSEGCGICEKIYNNLPDPMEDDQ